jgi:hypothetical protein
VDFYGLVRDVVQQKGCLNCGEVKLGNCGWYRLNAWMVAYSTTMFVANFLWYL